MEANYIQFKMDIERERLIPNSKIPGEFIKNPYSNGVPGIVLILAFNDVFKLVTSPKGLTYNIIYKFIYIKYKNLHIKY